MVLHWVRRKGPGWKTKAGINGFGTIVTATTLVIIVIMKFLQGAWVTLLCIILLVWLMHSIKKHYAAVSADLTIPTIDAARALLLGGDEPSSTPAPRGKVILPVQTLNRSFIKVLNCASDFEGAEIEYFHVASSEEQAKKLQAQFEQLGVRGTFVYEITHFRNTEEVLLRHIEAEHTALPPHAHLTVMMASLIVRNRWARPLHNQTTQTLIRRMEQYRNVYVFQVPYLI